MIEYSRRALLIGGGAGAASALAGSVAAEAAPPRGRSSGTLPISGFGNPPQIASIVPKTSGTVMQQIEIAATGELFMNQARAGSAAGLDTTVISRNQGPSVSTTQNAELDSMRVIDGGHGLGLHVEAYGVGRYWVWVSLRGENAQDGADGGRLARFRYTPGTFTIDAIPGGVRYLPRFRNAYGEYQESIYNFDWARDAVVERMFDFHTGHQERFTRRRITDLVLGLDRPTGRVVLPSEPPTLQGFTTMNDTLFRWCGRSNSGSGQSVAEDPMVMEQVDWRTGATIAKQAFPTLAQQDDGTWRDGTYEPEGCSVHRAPDGSVNLLVGVTTGGAGDHRWPVFEFRGIGTR